MKKTIYSIVAVGLLIALFVIQQWQNEQISTANIAAADQSEFTRADFLPTSSQQIVHHKSYSLSYNEKHEQAEWTIHVLKPSDMRNVDFIRPYFEIDEMITTGAASWRNYKNSGYDRGHLVPAGDRRGSIEDYEETFLTSNISPQRHEFNAGIWNRLEQEIRRFARNKKAVYIVTGSILKEGLPSIGNEQVSVPQQFYKIVYEPTSNLMIAYLLPHKESNQSLKEFIVSVDSIEQLTGVDFFSQLPDDIEEQLERTAVKTGVCHQC